MSFNPFARQLPAYSPLTAGVLLRGVTGLLTSREALKDEAAARLRATYSPRSLLLTDSGTTALRLALDTPSGKARPQPVALPAYGCYDVATAADGADVPVVLYDVDPVTLGPDLPSFEAALAAEPRVVVIVHLYGVPVDLASVRAHMERGAESVLVEDAAQGLGGSNGADPLGSSGSLSVLSFGRGKGLSGGGGGALLAHDATGDSLVTAARDRLDPAARRGWAELAAAAAQWAVGRPAVYGLPASLPFLSLGETTYEEPWPASEAASTSLAMVTAGWELARREAERRRRNADVLVSAVEHTDEIRIPRAPADAVAGYLRLPALAVSDEARLRLDTTAARRRGVMPGYPRPLHHLEGFRPRIVDAGRGDRRFPGAETLCRRLFTVPVHSRLTEEDLEHLARLLGGS